MIRLLNVVDEFTREALEMLVQRSIDSDQTVATLERLVAERGAPEHLRMDNGSELTAHALQDWCRFSKTGAAYIDPGSPWQNPFLESFHSRVRDELLDVEEFSCLAEAKVVISDWREDYNHRGKEALSQCGRRAAHLVALPGRDPVSCAPGRDLLQLLVRSLLDHGGRTGEHET